jgi:hypothetical protein
MDRKTAIEITTGFEPLCQFCESHRAISLSVVDKEYKITAECTRKVERRYYMFESLFSDPLSMFHVIANDFFNEWQNNLSLESIIPCFEHLLLESLKTDNIRLMKYMGDLYKLSKEMVQYLRIPENFSVEEKHDILMRHVENFQADLKEFIPRTIGLNVPEYSEMFVTSWY